MTAHMKTSRPFLMLCQCSLMVISSNWKFRKSQQRVRFTWQKTETAGQNKIQSLHFEPKSSCWKPVYCTTQRAVSKSKLMHRYAQITSLICFNFVFLQFLNSMFWYFVSSENKTSNMELLFFYAIKSRYLNSKIKSRNTKINVELQEN